MPVEFERDHDADAESTTGMSKEPATTLVNENVEHVKETINVGVPSVAGMTTQEMLDAIQSSDEEPEQARSSVETTRAARAVDATVTAAAIATNDCSTVATVHHVEWRRASSTEHPLNGNHAPCMWSVRNGVGENLYPGQPNLAINSMSATDFFLLIFPPKQLVAMVDLTNIELEKLEVNTTNTSDLLKFFGVLILMTSFEFTSRASLWSSVAPMKYQPAPHFGLTGMSRHCFDDLFRAIRWSKQPSERAENESTEQHRWKLLDDFVADFNDHRANYLIRPIQFVSTNP